MTPDDFFAAHGDALQAAFADLRTMDPEAFTRATYYNPASVDAARLVGTLGSFLGIRSRLGAS